ncbi:MAG: hypothetical protein ACK54L_13745, partial [Betaproteobacteria bacterium]
MLAVGAARRAHRDRPLRPHRSANLSSALPAPAALAGLEVRFAMALARAATVSRLAATRRSGGYGRFVVMLLASLALHLWWLAVARRELSFELPPPARALTVELFVLPAPVSVGNLPRQMPAAGTASKAPLPVAPVAPITPPSDMPPRDEAPASPAPEDPAPLTAGVGEVPPQADGPAAPSVD